MPKADPHKLFDTFSLSYKCLPSSTVIAAGNQRLNVGDNKPERIENYPSNHNSFEPSRCFIYSFLIARYQTNYQGNRRHRYRNNRTDRNNLTVEIPHYRTEPVPNGFGFRREYRLHDNQHCCQHPD